MKKEQLDIIKNKKGFIAALDQSGGSTKKVLLNYGINEDYYNSDEEMFKYIHEMRTRIITDKSFNKEKIIGVILFYNTMNSKIENKYTADYLWENKHILSFLKIDQGLDELKNGVQLLRNIDNLDLLLKEAISKNIFGTKMRSVIKEVNELGIKQVVEQQFSLAKKIYSYGLIPIIEPEVDIKAIEKTKCEEILLKYLKQELDKLDKDIKVIFKLTLPNIENHYHKLLEYDNVLRMVALSGGYSQSDACEMLKKNKDMSASFSRALLEYLNVSYSDDVFSKRLSTSINNIYDASVNKIDI